MNNSKIIYGKVSKLILSVYLFITILYFSWWLWPGNIENGFLYGLLFFGEIYHVSMAVGFIYTVWPRKNSIKKHLFGQRLIHPTVDVFITVAGEDAALVEKTVLAAKNMTYENHTVYILNDGYAAHKNNWKEIEMLGKRLGVTCITRKYRTGAKAGNINNALRQTNGEFIVIFDADMVPNPNFLMKLMPYFKDEKIAFAQSPQFYKNYQKNMITAGSWEQQNFFFGPIMIGKNNISSAFICGTNVVIRRSAIEEAGGMFEENIAEDFLTSLFIHKNKWKSIYIPEVLCEGLAPEDLLSYYKQQHRWARGSLEVLLIYNPLFSKGLSIGQRIQYLLSALFYLNGLIVVIDIVMPLLFLFFGLQAVSATTTSFAIFFFPYMFMCLYTIFLVSGESLTFRAISFSQASFVLQVSALFSVLLRRKTSFAVTAKKAEHGSIPSLVFPHLLYAFLAIFGVIYAIIKNGPTPEVITNGAWAFFNIAMFIPFIKAGFYLNKSFADLSGFTIPYLKVSGKLHG